ncbi:hypothetical protein [Quisquiliibacterium transsilvanicum]|uniref:Uncharacterized protein n=1 Tax=Quisquiliibacterium transsilvanicum TaxID=1549638 RepID=A0A7W8HG71_9BURK|nr:hypothetical protein [Quisquiliibacterium transsilvanicum]MBB5271353.1 hypothetical protein [Quisquiliibacterium transsilvanicum]
MTNEPRFARSGGSHEGGKLSRRLDIPVSEELEEAVIALAAVAGVPKAEFARTVLERAMFGDLSMLRRLARPLDRGRWENDRMNGGPS